MIQVKEFIDTDRSLAVERANAFLAGLKEEDVVGVHYGSIVKRVAEGIENQRSAILVVYRKDDSQK
ncbi:hypothetical protein DUZ99_11315 [Xylanibacillus composti]|nr:hypothetical protein [Xylanibacillus composti]